MLRWLLPQEDRFFALITQQVENVLAACQALLDMMRRYENLEEKAERIHTLEHQGDNLRNTIKHALDATFVTPIDREDIHGLAKSIDRINDCIDGAAKRMVLYRIKKPTPPMIKLGEILERCLNELCFVVPKLSSPAMSEDIRVHLRELDSLEKEADRIHQTAIAHLFQEEKDAIKVIKFKEVSELLESAVDACERVGQVIETIVVKHA